MAYDAFRPFFGLSGDQKTPKRRPERRPKYLKNDMDQLNYSKHWPSPISMKLGGVINIYEDMKTLKFFPPATSRGWDIGLYKNLEISQNLDISLNFGPISTLFTSKWSGSKIKWGHFYHFLRSEVK